MRAFRVTSDPDLPCRRVRRVIARSSADARCEGVWFWCPCIVKEIRTAKEQRP
jgi:hypothetical protein